METKGYHVKDYQQLVKRYVQTMELKDDPELIAEYTGVDIVAKSHGKRYATASVRSASSTCRFSFSAPVW